GAYRFLRRLWSFCYRHREVIDASAAQLQQWGFLDTPGKDLRRQMHQLLSQADYDYQRVHYNTVVSTGMKMLNLLEEAAPQASSESWKALSEGLSLLLRVLYPVVPHITWTLWQHIGYAKCYGDLIDAAWPAIDEAALEADELELVLQVNGKLRGALRVPAQADKATIEAAAQNHEATQKHLDGSAPKRIIIVPGRLFNVAGIHLR